MSTSTKIPSPQSADGKLPHWDMSVVYPGLDSPEFEQGFRNAVAAIEALEETFAAHGIGNDRPSAGPEEEIQEADVRLYERVQTQINDVVEQVTEISAYINGFVSTNSRDETAQAWRSRLQLQSVRLAKLGTRFTAWLGTLPVDHLIERSSVAADHAYGLRKAQVQAEHLLTPAEEDLVAELSPTGGGAWSKLYGNFTSQIVVTVEMEDETKVLPMSSVRNLAYHPERSVRRQAYVSELGAWEESSVPLAAALNSIKGEVNTMVKRRGWGSALELSLFQNNMDRASLDAMMAAAHESFSDFRRYLRLKARALDLPNLAFYDIFAPITRGGRAWSYEEGRNFIVEQFATFSPKMEELARRAFDEHWIDAEPRPGKRDGAFCMRLRRDESRILTNYKNDFTAVSTLAHELGHAYHNLNLAERTMMQKSTPMTLAETASIFCETIVKEAALERVSPQEQFVILENSLQHACQVVVDITSRFLFERAVFEKRQERELSADEFCDLMLDAQRQTYGDGLDLDQLHPYMWAAKSHYYSTGLSYYNYPYMFGMLFALGLYARYQETPDAFRQNYDDLLSATGMFPAAALAARFDIDIRTPDFWRGSLDVVRAEIDRFEQVVNEQT